VVVVVRSDDEKLRVVRGTGERRISLQDLERIE
jgi:hypothetical protein